MQDSKVSNSWAYNISLHVFVCGWVGMPVKVRGELAQSLLPSHVKDGGQRCGVSSLLPLCRFWEPNLGLQACTPSACIYPQNHQMLFSFSVLLCCLRLLGSSDLVSATQAAETIDVQPMPCPQLFIMLLLLLLQHIAMDK